MRNNLGKKLSAFLLTACLVLSGLNVGPKQVQAAAAQFTGTHFSDGFDSYDTNAWHKAVDYTNGDMFYCTWRDANVVFDDGVMEMSIKADTGATEYEKYSGGEYRTNQAYHYGMYQVNMKPIKNDGVVTSFFTYTGPSDDTNWDEIDIEFLGKDTTKVQFNYYTNGVGGHEYLYDLGFDASQGFHTYGFYWADDYIAWYVDDKEVYRTPASQADIIPDEPSRIMMNVWPGKGVDDWLNAYNGNTPLTAYYDWMSWDAPTGESDSGTGSEGGTGSGEGENAVVTTNELFTGDHYASSLTSYEDKMEISDGWSNGGVFNCTWAEDNINFSNDKLDVVITKDAEGNYYSGEYRTKNTFGYGMYQVSMKPIKQEGVATSFYTYAPAADYSTLGGIDVFFNGTNTEQVIFKWTKNGVTNEKKYDLGFDASEDYHTYGFYWVEEEINWYVDGNKLEGYTSTENIPTAEGRIIMNTWPGSTDAKEWLGTYNGTTPLTASYDWFAYDAPETTTITVDDFDGSKLYKIISKVSGKALDVENSAQANGTNVLQYTYNDNSNQKWYLKKQTNGYYTIENYATGKVLMVEQSSIANGANVYQWEYNGSASQEWSIYKEGDYYKIVNRNSEKALDVAGASTADNANIQQWMEPSESEAYLWSIEVLAEQIPQTELIYLPLEAELFTLGNKAIIQTGANLSNGYQVGELGNTNGGTATFTINADEARVRGIKLYYSSVLNRDVGVTVNDSATVSISCAGYGDDWYTPAATPATGKVELEEGSNTIVFGGVDGGRAANLDRIEIELTEAEAQKLVQTLINQLPDVEDVVSSDKMIINAVKAAYNALENKGSIDNSKLTAVVDRLTVIENNNLNVDIDGDGDADINIDTDVDGDADLNIDINGDNNPDLNVDTDGNGDADINIDTDDNGKADVNIDTNGDKIPDINVDTDDNGKADVNIDTNGDKIPDINVDTDGDGKADSNIDVDGDGFVDVGDENLQLDIDTDSDGIPDINIDTDDDGRADVNIDINGDKKADINIDTDKDGDADVNIDTNGDRIPDVNIDTNGDGRADVNIDTDGDGKADVNIDTNGDKTPDINIDTDNDVDKTPDVNVDTNDDGKADINVDTNNDGTPDVNIDTNGDKTPDINLDTDKDGDADVDIDTNGDKKPDVNVDIDGDGIPDINIDTNGDQKADINIDTDGDQKPNINVDTDNDGDADINIDTNNDGTPDSNVDADGDGVIDGSGTGAGTGSGDGSGTGTESSDVNIDTDGDGIPDVNIDTNGDKTPDVNVDTNGDKTPDVNIDTNGDKTPDVNIDTNGDKTPDVNIDTSGDKTPDVNIDTNGDKTPDVNIDTNGDKTPDVNVDTNGDKTPDVNIDINGDKTPDVNVDTNGDKIPDTNIDADGDGVVDGSGTGDGTGTGDGSGTGDGTGTGDGSGTDDGTSTGDGSGTGDGTGTGNESTNTTSNEIVEGSSVTQATQVITSNKTENDPKGSTFAKLSLRVAKTTKTSQKLKWNKVKGAKGYMIFGSKCGTKMKLLKTIKKGSTTSWTRKKLKKNTYYKYLILAYKVVDGEKVTISTSKTVHVPTTGGKYCDIKSVKVNKSKVTLKKGKTFTIKAKEVKAKSKQKIKRHRKIYFESTNKKVATVSSKGKITAKKRGTCYVYAYAQNGVFKKIKVTVK